MKDSIFYFTQFTIFFFLYIIFIPAKVMGLKLRGKEAGENALKALIVSHVTITSCVYLLGLLHIYNAATLFFSLIVVILVYWKLVKKVSYMQLLFSVLQWLALISTGQYKLKIYIKKAFQKFRHNVKHFYRQSGRKVFSKYILEYLILFLSLGILIIRKWPLVFDNYAYLTSDMYVHNEWINFMEQGDIFYDGVYPFGMHNMLSAFHKMAFLNLNIVFRYWGAFNCILLAVMIWFFACRIFQSKFAALLPVIIYCVTDFTSRTYGFRTIYTLPQETGMLFLLPCLYFFGRFLKRQKRKDGIYFSMSAAIILSMHFYTVIFAVLLCGSVCIPFVKTVIKPVMIKKLFLNVGLIALISITPFLLGLASGKQWQGSMGWALGVMNSAEQEAESNETDFGDAQEEDKEVVNVEEKRISFLGRVKNKLVAVYNLQVEDMNSYWGVIFWTCMGLFVIYYAGLIRLRKITWKDKMYAGIWIFLLLLVVMYSYEILGLPKIMKEERMTMFMGYIAPLILALPAEILCRVIPGKIRFVSTIGSFGMGAVLFYVTYGLGYVPVQSYYYLETSLAAKTCVKADEELPKGTWTVVSPVDELALVRNRGYHYELWEFISNMEVYNEEMYLEIPTKYVFFVLEKKPFLYNEVRYTDMEYDDEPIRMFDAYSIFTKEMLGISDAGMMKFYNILTNRRTMEAKFYYWLEEYKKAFPDQMEVYLEDDECIVYKFQQNPYMLNNFAINYGFNEFDELDYYERLRRKMSSRGEDVSEVEKKILELQEERETVQEKSTKQEEDTKKKENTRQKENTKQKKKQAVQE